MSFSKCTGKCHHGVGKWSKTRTIQVREPPLVFHLYCVLVVCISNCLRQAVACVVSIAGLLYDCLFSLFS